MTSSRSILAVVLAMGLASCTGQSPSPAEDLAPALQHSQDQAPKNSTQASDPSNGASPASGQLDAQVPTTSPPASTVSPLHPPLVTGTYFLHLDQCVNAGQLEANCLKGYSTAYSMHENFRPSYNSRELCQNVFERCTTFDPATPIMEGFGMLPTEKTGEWFFMPLYKAKGGQWVEVQQDGTSFKLIPLP